MRSRFRKLFLNYLKKAFQEGKLKFHGQMAYLTRAGAFEALCRQTGRIKWVVFAKPPFGGPERVLKYLALYTHRVAISNRRLLSMEDGRVSFEWKDHAGGNQTRTMTLDAVEFIRRFLLHVLPCGFVRIRHFGFLANRARGRKLALCRTLLGAPPTQATVMMDWEERTGEHGCKPCPVCKIGYLIPIGIVATARQPPPRQDSS